METSYKGNNRMITGIVFGVLTYWLFSQSLINVMPAVQADMGISLGVLNTAISLTGLFSGMFIVAAGGISDRIGRKKITTIGLILNIIGSLCLIFAQGDGSLNYWACDSRLLSSVYYACDDCFSENLF